METIETLIPDNEGNHLVVVLSFYEENDKTDTFNIPTEFAGLNIADISIEKLNLCAPLHLHAFFEMCRWLWSQFLLYPNTVFSFICSTDPLDTRHAHLASERYRWNLFEYFYQRNRPKLEEACVRSKDIVVGPEGFQTFARVFYRDVHAPVINLVIEHLTHKYS